MRQGNNYEASGNVQKSSLLLDCVVEGIYAPVLNMMVSNCSSTFRAPKSQTPFEEWPDVRLADTAKGDED